MSTRLRFTEARQVFDAFPRVAGEIALAATEEPPLDFAQKLIARANRFDAIVYIACLLPRREAVWWGAQCVRALVDKPADAALLAAEAWVREPEEASRRAALDLATTADITLATTWLARAAGYSGGSITPEGAYPAPASPDATAVNVKAAVILALVERPLAVLRPWINACAEAGIRFADGGDAKVVPPARPAA
jgi:hypothetical protein